MICEGYHACRMLAASTDIATIIGTGIRENHDPDEISAAAYQAIWGKQNRGQRDFQVCFDSSDPYSFRSFWPNKNRK